MKYVRFLIALVLCTLAILMPFKLRTRFGLLIARVIHFPFNIFGLLAKFLLSKLDIDPSEFERPHGG